MPLRRLDLVVLTVLLIAQPALAAPDEITLFSERDFAGQSFTTKDDMDDAVKGIPFEPRSAKVTGHWDICGEVEFTNPCTVLRRDTPNFDYVPDRVGAKSFRVKSLFATYRGVDQPADANAPPRLELYERAEFMGQRLMLTEASPDITAPGPGGRPLSAHVTGRWQLCAEPNFAGACVVLEGEQLGLAPDEAPPVIRSARPTP
ncbi:MAG: beta/gamma crystallin-related protein [Pseudomonadota bacterium]